MSCLVNLLTEEHIQSITFSKSDVIKRIRALDANKAHGYDNISVRIIKLCTHSVAHPLTLIFKNSMAAGTFATQWKRENIVPINKKNDKQIASNYRPVSLLPLCSKIFEKLIFNELFNFFCEQYTVAYLRGCVWCGRTPLRILSALFRMLSAIFAHYFVLKSEHFKSILQSYEVSSWLLKITISKFITSSLQPANLILVNFAYFFTFSFLRNA